MMSGVIVDGRTMNYYYDHSKTRVVKYNPQSGYIKFYPNKYFEKETTGEKTKYVFLGNQRIAIIDNEGTHLNFSDHLNSSSVTTDINGNITNLIDYLPFGSDRVNVSYSSSTPNYLFTDQEKDNESDQYYMKARYYGQSLGRFNTVDVAAFYQPNIIDPQQLNYYSYARNNPVHFVDPTGNVIIETNDENRTMMTIESGDTLSQIAGGFNMDYQTLADQLGIEDPNKISAGAVYDITDVTDSNGVNIVGLGSVFIDLGNHYSVRVDPPNAGNKANFNAHLYKNGVQQEEYSQDMYGKAREGKQTFPDKIQKQLEGNKKWNQKLEKQKEWERDHKNDQNNKSGGVGSSDSGQGTSSGFTNPNTLFILPVPYIAPMPSFIFGPIFAPSPILVL